ncbi:MAG: AAA family ATPase, partial [Ferruginibacter sp.]
MLSPDTHNTAFQLATGFINQTNQPVFLTGKAGTGKTTFLKYIKEKTLKSVVVVAPTGVAAMNAGGTTIHSFFQLPFAPFIGRQSHFSNNEQNDLHSLINHLRLSPERKEIIQQLDLLIIDEVSMVRADVLDAIDVVLRHVRNNNQAPFGGVQVLYIGDMYQLPPVVKNEEWQLLQTIYESPFFFSSQIIKTQPPVYIELDKVYRQKDKHFINLLNQVRNNEMDEDGYELLHSRYKSTIDSNDVIVLTTHNAKAQAINETAISALNAKAHYFNATVDGSFLETAYPTEEKLLLKVGAQVMFLKNDTETPRRFFNGKIGIVEKIE